MTNNWCPKARRMVKDPVTFVYVSILVKSLTKKNIIDYHDA